MTTTNLDKYNQLSKEILTLSVYDDGKQKELIAVFEQLTDEQKEQNQYMQLHVMHHLERLHNKQKDSERRKFANMGFPLPMEVKNSYGHPHADLGIVMACDNTIHSIFTLEHLHNIMLPKRCFMVYGTDGSGKTTVVTKMYDLLKSQNPDIPILYLRDNIDSWKDQIVNRWTSLVSYVTFVIEKNSNGWILLELEHFDLLASQLTFNYETLKPFIDLQRVIVVGVTDHPSLCENAFKNNFSMSVFVDYPSTRQIKEILTLWFLKLVHNQTEISRRKSTYKDLWQTLSNKVNQIALKLTCHKTKIDITCENKTKCNELRLFSDDQANDESLLTYGIAMNELTNFLIPRLEGCIVKLRKNWYNKDKKCFVEQFDQQSQCSNADDPKSKTSLVDILDTKQNLTKNQLLQINGNNLDCAKIQKSSVCDKTDDFQITWKWISESSEQILTLMDEILLNVEENEKRNKSYKELVQYFIDAH